MDNKFVMVYADDVKVYGPYKAIILGVIKNWCETNRKSTRYEFDGFYWSGHITKHQIVEQTGLPLETVKKNLKWLIDNNVIIKGNFNKHKYDKTGWYRNNQSVLIGTYSGSSEERTQVPDRNYGECLVGTIDEVCEELTIPTNPTTNPSINQTINPSTITTTIPLLTGFKKKNTIEALNSKKSIPDKARSAVIELISTGMITRGQKDTILNHIEHFKSFKVLEQILNFQ